MAAVTGEKTLAELTQRYDVLPNLINQWRAKLLESAADVFGAEPSVAERVVDVKVLHAKSGELTLANDTLDADFCMEALEEALARFGKLKKLIAMKAKPSISWTACCDDNAPMESSIQSRLNSSTSGGGRTVRMSDAICSRISRVP